MRVERRGGFTLIELLSVLLVIGVLAAIAMLKFGSTKDRAYVATMKSDLHTLATAEESYNAENKTYSTSLSAINFVASPSVTATVTDASASGWAATVTHAAISTSCRVGVGADSIPGVGDGVIDCN